jgi:hypothetical protein
MLLIMLRQILIATFICIIIKNEILNIFSDVTFSDVYIFVLIL